MFFFIFNFKKITFLLRKLRENFLWFNIELFDTASFVCQKMLSLLEISLLADWTLIRNIFRTDFNFVLRVFLIELQSEHDIFGLEIIGSFQYVIEGFQYMIFLLRGKLIVVIIHFVLLFHNMDDTIHELMRHLI